MEDIPEAVKRAFPYITVKVWNLLNEYHRKSLEGLAGMDEEDVEEVEEALKDGFDNAVPLELVKKRLEDRE